MWKYYCFRLIGPPLSLLPMKIGYLIAYIVADTVYLLSPGLRGAIADNIRHVLEPDVDDATLRRTVKGVLRNAAKNYFDLIKVPRLKLDNILDRITVHGWHNYEEALNRGKGVIIVTAHIGSFDMTAQLLAARAEGTIVLVEGQEPPALHDYVTNLRKSKGLTILPIQAAALRIIMQSLHCGETVGLVCDRDIGKDGMKSTFFGEQTTLPVGPVRIAMRTGAPIVPAYNLRREGSRYDVYLEPALDIIQDGDDAVRKNMHLLIQALEKSIRTCPEQWVVLGPIWENGYLTRCAAKSQRLIPTDH